MKYVELFGPVPRDPETEEEHELFFNVKNRFWNHLGWLVAKSLVKVPAELRLELMAELQERSSVFGTKYDDKLAFLIEQKKIDVA